MENSVEPSAFGSSVNVRTPLNMGAIAWLQIIERPGRAMETLGLKTRVGAVGTLSFKVWPSAIDPSMLVTVAFQRGNPAASVNSAQMRSGLARMVVRIAQVIRNAVL